MISSGGGWTGLGVGPTRTPPEALMKPAGGGVPPRPYPLAVFDDLELNQEGSAVARPAPELHAYRTCIARGLSARYSGTPAGLFLSLVAPLEGAITYTSFQIHHPPPIRELDV